MSRASRAQLLCLIVGVGLFCSLLWHYSNGYYRGQGYPESTFLFQPRDGMNDFHNINNLVRSGDPYGQSVSVYLPFTYLPLYLLKPFGPRASLWIFLIACSAVMFLWLLSKVRTGARAHTALTGFVLCFLSYPFLFWLDRANLEGLVFIYLACFFYLLDRHPRWAALALGAAIAVKGYPGVFVVLLLLRRDWRGTALALVTPVVLTLGSAALYPGGVLESLSRLREFLHTFEVQYVIHDAGLRFSSSYFGLVKLAGRYLFGPGWSPESIMVWYSVSCVALFVLTTVYLWFIERVFWRQVALLTFALLLFPQVSYDYKLIHLFFPLGLFLAAEERQRGDGLYAVLFGLLLIPKAYGIIKGGVKIGVLDVNIGVVINPLLMTGFVAAIVIGGLRRFRSSGHRNGFSPQTP